MEAERMRLFRPEVHILILLSALMPSHVVHAGEYTRHPGALRLTYEPVTLANDESLGLLGIHTTLRAGRYLSLGVAGYGAVSGERGGFLVGGYSADLNFPINRHVSGNTSLFVGGGGGGAAPQGGGLMLRTDAGLNYHGRGFLLGTGLSHIRFPNGKIDSVQPYLAFTLPFSTFVATGWENEELQADALPFPLYERRSSLALSYKHYRGSGLFSSPTQPSAGFSLIGIDWQHDLPGVFYYTLSAHGSYQGNAAGYAEAMFGSGYRWQFTPHNTLRIAATLGSGGGGNVDTGGGALGGIVLNLEQAVGDTLHLRIMGGYTEAFRGNFGGFTAGVALGMSERHPVSVGWEGELPSTAQYHPQYYRIRLVEQHYSSSSTIPRAFVPQHSTVDLMGVQIDRFITKQLYLTGQAMGAWRGEAGGYASGMIGAGVQLPLASKLRLQAEMNAGAAGGGGLKVGDGLLVGGTMAAVLALSGPLELQVGLGRIKAYDSPLDARQITVALSYRFTRAER